MKSNKGVLNEYPRPDFARNEWMNLNGKWEFEYDDSQKGLVEEWYKKHDFFSEILVPYCYQSELSGIGDTSDHAVVWYKKVVELDSSFLDQKVMINFGAVDFESELWVNGQSVGTHRGGNTAFKFDVTRFLKEGENTLVMRVQDDTDPVQPRGKQSWVGQPFACWYTPTTGIWLSVWLEKVGTTYVESLYITPDIDKKTARMELTLSEFKPKCRIRAEITLKGKFYKTIEVTPINRYPNITIDIDTGNELDPRYLWHPDNPTLFDVEITLLEEETELDRVQSYFGMRKISVRDGIILINNTPYFQKLILDQGYWEESLLTPPSDDALKEDIEKAMAMGFNGARKHQKMEDSRFYYWADKLGFLVWGEMPSSYNFTRKGVDLITEEWKEFIMARYNHPSIVTWVPLNESWGVWNILVDKQKQDFNNALYYLTKSLDQTRLVSGNDGWEQADTDICAVHDYVVARGEDFLAKTADKERYLSTLSDQRFIYADGQKHKGQPVLLTEYGGIAFEDGKEGWGYQDKVKDEAAFLERFKSITESIKQTGYFYGLCYTQLTDVQQEVNGLLYPDRTYKIAPEKIKEILDNIK